MRPASLLLALALLTTGCLGLAEDTEPEAEAGGTGSTAQALAGPTPNATGADPDGPEPGGFSDTHVFEGNYTTDAFFSQVLHEGPYAAKAPELVTLQSPVDDVPIGIELHRPEVPDGMAVPVIVQASPYYEDDPSRFPVDAPDGDTYAAEGLYSPALVDNYVGHGYAVALVALRGTADSGGCWDTLGPKTGQDLEQAISWLSNRSWSTGAIGIMGAFSQDGAAAWQAAATGNPHIRTVVPVAAWADHYGLLFRNGSYSGLSATFWATAAQGTAQKTEPPTSPAELTAVLSRGACPEVAEGIAASAHAVAAGASDPTGYWVARDLRDDILANYTGSVFVVHGLDDPSVRPSSAYPFVHELEAKGLPVKQLLGQWAHVVPDVRLDEATVVNPTPPAVANPTPRMDFAEILLHWFDYWLKGELTRDLGPRVQVADSDGQWRSAETWPPGHATQITFHLHPDGSLAPDRTDETATRQVGPDARQFIPAGTPAASQVSPPCPGCHVFATEPLEQPLRWAGSPRAHLAVTPTGPGGYLTVELALEAADGTTRTLTTGQMDLRFAEGDRAGKPVTPGQAMVAPLELEPQDVVAEEGQRLLLEITQGSQGGRPTWMQLPGVPPTPVNLHLGDARSVLTLETFEVDTSATFTPPGRPQSAR